MHEHFDWDDLRFFLAAAHHEGFGVAGRALKTQQSTVSRRVAGLERRLGGALFDRTSAGLVLTRLGAQVRSEAQGMADRLARVTDAAAAQEHAVEGLVRIALTESLASAFVIPRVLPALLRAHPGLRVDLVISDHAADLARREADLALRFFLQPRGDLLTRRLARMRSAVLASRVLAKRLRRVPLAKWPFLSLAPPGVTFAEEVWRQKYAPGEVQLSTNSHQAVVAATVAGVGVAVLPAQMTEVLPLTELPLPATVPAPQPIDLYLVTPRALRRVPRVATVHAALEESFRELN